jgi:hypothetical protein
MTYGRVWCPIDELWRVFPERLAWMAEPCRALALQLGLRVHTVYAMAVANAQFEPNAIPEAEALYDEHLEAIHDNGLLRAAQRGFPLSILAMAKRARIAVERVKDAKWANWIALWALVIAAISLIVAVVK